MVDPLTRKGYRFKGPAQVYERGSATYEEGLEHLRQAGSRLVDRVKAIVVLEVRAARPLISPLYDDGSTSEDEVVRVYRARFAQPPSSPSGI